MIPFQLLTFRFYCKKYLEDGITLLSCKKIDKQLSASKRADSSSWRRFWDSELETAKLKGDTKRAYYIARRIAGKGLGPKRRLFGAATSHVPSAMEWANYLALPGPLGGCSAKVIAYSANEDHSPPFWRQLQDFAKQQTLVANLPDKEGGRGKYVLVSSSVPMSIKNRSILQLDLLTEAQYDVDRLLRGIRESHRG